jgi:hypothetical protein
VAQAAALSSESSALVDRRIVAKLLLTYFVRRGRRRGEGKRGEAHLGVAGGAAAAGQTGRDAHVLLQGLTAWGPCRSLPQARGQSRDVLQLMARMLGMSEEEAAGLGLAGGRGGLLRRVVNGAGRMLAGGAGGGGGRGAGGGDSLADHWDHWDHSLADHWVDFLLSRDEAARQQGAAPGGPQALQGGWPPGPSGQAEGLLAPLALNAAGGAQGAAYGATAAGPASPEAAGLVGARHASGGVAGPGALPSIAPPASSAPVAPPPQPPVAPPPSPGPASWAAPPIQSPEAAPLGGWPTPPPSAASAALSAAPPYVPPGTSAWPSATAPLSALEQQLALQSSLQQQRQAQAAAAAMGPAAWSSSSTQGAAAPNGLPGSGPPSGAGLAPPLGRPAYAGDW